MRASQSTKIAFIIACATMLAGAIGFRAVATALNAWLLKEPAPLREPLGTIPRTLGAWRAPGPDNVLDAETLEALGTKFYLDRVYAIDGDQSKGVLMLHVAFYTGLIDRVPHVPERCLAAGGLEQVGPSRIESVEIDRSEWKTDGQTINVMTGLPYPTTDVVDPVTRRSVEVHLPIGDAAITLVEFQDPASPALRVLGGYLFVANGRMTPRAGDIRELSYSPTERYAYFAKIQFMGMSREGSGSFEDYKAHVADLLGELLPHLMKRLPDWPEYEARSAPTPSSN